MTRPLGLAAMLTAAALLQACTVAPPAPPAAVVADQDAVVCRDTLVRGSNAHRVVCLTPDQWERLERAETRAAQRTALQMQGSSYGGGY